LIWVGTLDAGARAAAVPPGFARRGTLAPAGPSAAPAAPVHDIGGPAGQRHMFPIHPLAGAPRLCHWPGGRCTSPPTSPYLDRATAHTESPHLGAQETPPTASCSSIKGSSPSFLAQRRATASHHCRRFGSHGELHPPAVVTVNTYYSYLP
jgi:hypothetical protein